ncbi:MAG: ubiquinol-cytochrome c reductase iron-sulfur subunit N-terminal domain-containing protein, partial [Alphaproteobacteria bacterium]
MTAKAKSGKATEDAGDANRRDFLILATGAVGG